jgi:hypothetical protein
VLRTEHDWSIFWIIPKLNTSGWTVQDKCDWINTHNKSDKLFKPSDWKNARRPERQVNMIPKNIFEDLLEELLNDI